ncbi:MAG: carbohydrate kinase family protein [Patescibacteria group bacterium]
MFDVITIGAATQDVFLMSKGFHLMRSSRMKRICECFPLGEKINVERIDFETGGGATNAAATFRNLGFSAGVIAKVGDDSAGAAVVNDLRGRGLKTDWVRHVAGGTTGFAAILLTPHGDRTALVHRGVSASFSSADIPWQKLNAAWLVVTSLAGNIALLKRLINAACARGVRVAFNPGMGELRYGLEVLRKHCSAAHVLLLNRGEANMLASLKFWRSGLAPGARDIRALRRRLSARFQNAVVVTEGARGAYYWDQRQFLWAQSKKVKVVNSTGAGDAFGAGFISGILRWRDPARALQLATLNALGTIQQMGAKKGLLTKWPTQAILDGIKITSL